MITFGYLEIVLAVLTLVFFTAAGALASSLLNHRLVRSMKRDMEQMMRDLEHTKNNQRSVKQALEVRQAKEDAATDLVAKTLVDTESRPRDVTIINTPAQPVPVQPTGDLK